MTWDYITGGRLASDYITGGRLTSDYITGGQLTCRTRRLPINDQYLTSGFCLSQIGRQTSPRCLTRRVLEDWDWGVTSASLIATINLRFHRRHPVSTIAYIHHRLGPCAIVSYLLPPSIAVRTLHHSTTIIVQTLTVIREHSPEP